jgi:hypothetical protein
VEAMTKKLQRLDRMEANQRPEKEATFATQASNLQEKIVGEQAR